MITWYIIAALFLGILAGYASNMMGAVWLNPIFSDTIFNLSLFALLFLMGIIFGMDRQAVSKLKETGFKILIFPFTIVLGSITGGFIGALILGTDIFAAMGVCAGCGWYTLTGPLAGQLFGLKWGAIGFTVNFLRELITIVAASPASKIDRYAPVAMGGATAMDTTLPVIVRATSQDMLITAFTSGFIITLLAPFMITAIATLAG